MKVLVQRVSRADVTVDGRCVGRIGAGLLLLVGVERGDASAQALAAAERVAGLRIFPDEAGRMARDVREAGGGVLVVPQFTLAASLRRGRRPSFDGAAPPEQARALVAEMEAALAALGLAVERGEFGAHMEVALVNDGPVTFLVEAPPDAQPKG